MCRREANKDFIKGVFVYYLNRSYSAFMGQHIGNLIFLLRFQRGLFNKICTEGGFPAEIIRFHTASYGLQAVSGTAGNLRRNVTFLVLKNSHHL